MMRPYEEAFEKLARIESMEQNWDTYDAQPIGPVVVARARALLGVLRDQGVVEPFVSPVCYDATTSGLQLEWGSDDPDWLEVDLRPDDIEVAGEYGGADVYAAFRKVANPTLAFFSVVFFAQRMNDRTFAIAAEE